MNEQQPDFPTIDIKPIISYPREAQAGQTYLMTIDVQLATPDIPWPYPEEEYPISFILDTQPYFSYEPLDGRERGVVLHRFGGTYGPAKYLLTATREAVPGHIHITLINGGGLPIGHMELECTIVSKAETVRPRKTTIVRQAARKREQEQPAPQIAAIFAMPPAASAATPARNAVEEQLILAGWVVQDAAATHIDVTPGIAIREFPLLPGWTDYLLVVDGEAIGVIEDKKGTAFPRSAQSVQNQLWEYQNAQPAIPSSIRFQRRPLPFAYGVVGHEIQFTNHLEPDTRTRSVFHFHRPETLARWLSQAPIGTPNELNDLLRSRLRRMPPLENEDITNQEAFQALAELEKSLAANRPRALIRMPRGVGNTITLAYMAYRLLFYARAQRVLFLVNSDDYAQTVYNCLEKIRFQGQERSFVEQYKVQILRNNKIDSSAKVVISTVVQLYMALVKEDMLIFDEAHRSPQGFSERHLLPLTEIPYNNALSLECFDAIMINNCPSEVYRDWRLLLEYFDAFIIGAANIVEPQIRGFFNGNLVYNYGKEGTPFAIAERLWKYYDKLRGYGFTPEDYLEQLTYLLFIKNTDEYLPEPAGKEHLKESGWEILRGGYGHELIYRYQDALHKFNWQHDLMRTIFETAQNKFQNPDTLRMLIELIEREYHPELRSEALGSIYEKLLEKCAESGKERIGQYFTPHALVQSIIDVMQPEAEMRICDPACGAGEFLVAAYKHAANEKQNRLDRKKLQQLQEDFVSGWEGNENISKIGTMNLFVHGIATEAKPSPIRTGDSLLGMHISELFDMVLCNPPFGRKYNAQYEESRAGWGISTRNADLAYIQLAYALLKPGGRAAIVAPNNVLFRKGAGEYIRRSLLGTCDFHTLLLLPENTFYHTGSSGVALFFDKLPSNEYPGTQELWVYDLRTNLHFTQRKNPLRWKHFEDFVRCYNPENRYLRRETERFRRFSYEELIKRESCNFNISWISDRESMDWQFNAWLTNQQITRIQPFTNEQILWLERIRDRIAAAGTFAEQDFERSPFTFDGGLVAARFLFGNELPAILLELNRLLIPNT